MTRQNSQEYAEEIARQAGIYKNMRMPKSEDTPEDDGTETSENEDT
jgi:hypothetical protein